jgi:hypothetical protein
VKTCCARFLVDTGFDGNDQYFQHERQDWHTFHDAGETCCPTPAAEYKKQRCYCRAARWVRA